MKLYVWHDLASLGTQGYSAIAFAHAETIEIAIERVLNAVKKRGLNPNFTKPELEEKQPTVIDSDQHYGAVCRVPELPHCPDFDTMRPAKENPTDERI